MKRALFSAAGFLAAIAAGSALVTAPCSAQSDDFDDDNDSGWEKLNPLGIASYSAAGGRYRVSSPASPNPAAFGSARAASLRQDAVYTDFYVVVDIVAYDAGLPQAIGILARVEPNPGPGNVQGYTFTYQPQENDVQINRITGEQPAGVSPALTLSPAPAPGAAVRMVFFGIGSYLEGRIYAVTDLLTPLVFAVATDGTYPEGTCGVVVSDNSNNGDGPVDASFDNYFANACTAPLLSITKDASAGITVRWPDHALGWRLQTTTSLDAGTWGEVISGLTQDGNERVVAFSQPFASAGPQRYWRLRL